MSNLAEPASPVPHVAVLIATFRRPQGLRELLESLDAQILTDDQGKPLAEMEIVVVDNDSGAPLRDHGIDPAAWTRHHVTYAVEPQRGVAAVRNRALQLAPAEADWVAFIDDDEIASHNWLISLLSTARRYNAIAVQGPVQPRYEIAPDAWLDHCGLYRLGPYRDGEPLNFAATNNSIVDKRVIDRLGLRFDMRFNFSGGEDQDFFSRLLAVHPGCIVASADAVVTDLIPASRMNMRWALRRSYRMGNSLGRITVINAGGTGKLRRVGKAIGRIFWGLILAALYSPIGMDPGRRGVLDMARGAGSITGLAGIEFQEYADPARRGSQRTGLPCENPRRQRKRR